MESPAPGESFDHGTFRLIVESADGGRPLPRVYRMKGRGAAGLEAESLELCGGATDTCSRARSSARTAAATSQRSASSTADG